MRKVFKIHTGRMEFPEICRFVFRREEFLSVAIEDQCLTKAKVSSERLHRLIEDRLPIYGVTTGFGDSCFRVISPENSEVLQANLVSYLLCGSGPLLPVQASRAMFLFRLKSLSRGYSGVSVELLQRMQLFLSNDWIPAVPREGSLGASGDLIPLAYLALCLQGKGQLHIDGSHRSTAEVLRSAGVEPYVLKAKEGLALVNGTSAMAGLYFANFVAAKHLLHLSTVATAWLCLAIRGRMEPFGALVNERASQHRGQATIAQAILQVLVQENYRNKPLGEVEILNSKTAEHVQDRYSLRCGPQILGPVAETLDQLKVWLEEEVNGTSDNPLLDDDGSLGMGGNFYGGYLSQGMDYLKISLAHIADMMDRQLATLIDEKYNRGLPPNLANWNGLPKEQHFLHHGLKGLHQAVSALTSEILAKSIPNGIFSRSTECHNQDKVSLGMSAAVQCSQMLEQMYTSMSMSLICLAQALDLREIQLQGAASRGLYEKIRSVVPFVTHDQALDVAIRKLSEALREQAAGAL